MVAIWHLELELRSRLTGARRTGARLTGARLTGARLAGAPPALSPSTGGPDTLSSQGEKEPAYAGLFTDAARDNLADS